MPSMNHPSAYAIFATRPTLEANQPNLKPVDPIPTSNGTSPALKLVRKKVGFKMGGSVL